MAATAAAQTAVDTVSGTVIERRSGRPLPSATVLNAATGARVATDPRGRFTVTVSGSGPHRLSVSAIGFNPATVTAAAGQRDLQIPLEEATIELEELVVTGTAGASTDPAAIQQQIVTERSRELFLESHRLGDVIRCNIPLTPVAETPYPKTGVYGNTTCLPLPDRERDANPNI